MFFYLFFDQQLNAFLYKTHQHDQQHLNRLKNLKDRDILVTLGPTKCTKYLFGIFNANDENELKDLIGKLKEVNNNPIAVGFGISTPEHVNKVREWGADGVIIGSAFVKRISSASEKDVISHVGQFCKEMRLAADKKK